ncbi:hypothetical protein OAU26_02620 [Mariniblastus sp.]|nr:hypothetical protein [Mariniblastus sp.]MDA7923102.1 hypothetical protein [bacterium]MDA7925436.1 hypothetical protein [Mariniblastus sp.]MDB4545185.1 hypothetical protein [bacterium]MDC3223804.1 hypothetical protein [Mariniblastus sp.]
MANRKRNTKPKGRINRPEVSDSPKPSSSPDTPDLSPLQWTPYARAIATVLILVYLFVVLIGPLANPIASKYFSGPIARQLAPLHRILFLGHGYRFFGPDPGPTHRLVFRGIKKDGSKFEGFFPDRRNQNPRLLYHRWFMLSETLFVEHANQANSNFLKNRQVEYEQQAARLASENRTNQLRQLKLDRQLELRYYQRASERTDFLANSVARVLLDSHQATSIELFSQERSIPFPEEVADGLKLNSEQLLLPPIKIGELDTHGYRAANLADPNTLRGSK